MGLACALQVVAYVCGTTQLITQVISQEENAGARGGKYQQYVHASYLVKNKVRVPVIAIGVSDKQLDRYIWHPVGVIP